MKKPSRPAPANYWIDGKLIGQADACVPLSDLAVGRGYAAFDALRTYGGTPFLLPAHLKRFQETCRLLYLKVPVSRSALTRAVLATVKANRFPESLIRLYLTGGDAVGFVPEHRERLIIRVDALKPYPSHQYENGIALATTRLSRTLPLAKSTDYVAGIRETIRTRREGFDEVVFLDEKSNLLEGTTFNVAVIRGRELITPATSVLRGVTIEHLLTLASKVGLKVRRAPLSPSLVREADEVFATSSIREVVPVVRIDAKRIAGGLPGPITGLLHELYCGSARSLCSRAR